jgi:CheY-like chemotaxis protein
MKIMFIDDEPRRMRVVVEELEEAGHEVLFQDNVDPALAILRDPSQSFDLVIIDISMPSGEEYKFEDTDGGSRTGISLYETIRGLRPDLKIVVFTNVSDRRVAERFTDKDDPLCRFVRKPDILPFQFVELVNEFVNGTNSGDNQ